MPKQRVFNITPPKSTSSEHISLPDVAPKPIHEQQFSFRIECCNGNCCYKKITEIRDKADFADRLHELSQLTWGDINDNGRKAFGYETLDNVKLRHNHIPKKARIIGFIYHDNHRMMGYRDNAGMFHILWFDYDGKRYKHS